MSEQPGASARSAAENLSAFLEDARKRWIAEERSYQDFGGIIGDRLEQIARDAGVRAEIVWRTKRIDSLVKKLIRKPHHTYDSLPDKVGARAVVRYKREIPVLIEAMNRLLSCSEPDDKGEELGEERVGYQSIHIEVSLGPNDSACDQFPAREYRAEVQIRTLAQHLWSEMAHDLSYKSASLVPQTFIRRVHLLAALIEVADNEFSSLDQELRSRPEMHEQSILKALESQYYKLTSEMGDPVLSLEVIGILEPLYASPPSDWSAYFETLVNRNMNELREVFSIAAENARRSAFMFQPEVLMIYDQLGRAPYELRQAWNRRFPEKELDDLAIRFGFSFD